MTSPVSKNTFNNPTLQLKQSDSSQVSSNVITPLDFQNYVYTGIKIEIKTPLNKTSREAIFAINTDGFIPSYSIVDGASSAFIWSNINRNLFPVQVFRNALNYVEVKYEPMGLPSMMLYNSHRFISGSIGIGLRITSNTSQSGNFLCSQATGVNRNYYADNELYQGLRFNNSSHSPSDYQVGNFAIVDVSLNRELSLTVGRNDPNKVTDLANKKYRLTKRLTKATTLNQARAQNSFSSQYLEDWILFTPLSDFPNANANKIIIDVFFDYSRVQFLQPMFPLIPSPPTNPKHQIMSWSKTFNDKLAQGKGTIVWLE